ncbi:hypothetical protein KL925_000671 [Ogataea polymorpha]|nr:hypothetical protein KL937_000450 [Ogataea polymorpha]KAG7895964.1 hypothetical protein KL936_000672 [Ogataea polymorpha]KAG7929929.1 hypothetical protein KL925_000671 [Ogataea polymorpha]KAG7939514.1 hypothetical protein KL934_000448 [Ogataea polymorpha]KAG7940233.1 hypothetical protein KL904_000096 [Ogataea polymorpha]
MVSKYNFVHKDAYRYTFIIYCGISAVKMLSMLLLSPKCEISYVPTYENAANKNVPQESSEPNDSTPLLVSTVEHQTVTGLSPSTQKTLFKLLLTFTIDSFGAGFMPLAWIIYYFKYEFDAPAATLGAIFSSLDILQALAAIPSACDGHGKPGENSRQSHLAKLHWYHGPAWSTVGVLCSERLALGGGEPDPRIQFSAP